MDALDGKVRRLLRSRDAEISTLRGDLAKARTDRAKARAMLDELGDDLRKGREQVGWDGGREGREAWDG